MNLDLLLSFVQAPQKMVNHPVSDLEGMVAEYPYFSAAQLLLLKQYKLQNSSKFNKQLRHAAGVLPDRKQLYRIVEMWPEEIEHAIAADVEMDVLPVSAEQLGLLQEEQSNLLTEAPSLKEPAQTMVEAIAPDAEADEVIEAPMEALADTEVEEMIAETLPPVEEWPVSEATEAATLPEVLEQEQQTAETPAASSGTEALEPAVSEEEQPVAPAVIAPVETITDHHDATSTAAAPMAQAEVEAFIARPHDRLSWFKFFAGKPLREQSDEVLDQLYQEHMQQDLLRAPEQDQQISAIRAQINRDEEVPSSKALEDEIRRLAYESISDEELPASETLAGIYAAQHDYKKAIRIYQKLILKFPDKMSYFARLIEELRANS
jgi:tetratricopeptide (TPR) repeat protein